MGAVLTPATPGHVDYTCDNGTCDKDSATRHITTAGGLPPTWYLLAHGGQTKVYCSADDVAFVLGYLQAPPG